MLDNQPFIYKFIQFESMEGGKLALQQYKKSKQISRYKLLAQKLSQHIQNFAEDPNTRQRWIWQLIQNAKDAPNEFNKVKIIIEVNEDNFKFFHNGDPFKPHQLESVINQYSSKSAENKLNVETTGKYGTGFITTYIISRKLTISGIHKVSINPQLVKMQLTKISDDWSDDQQQIKPPASILNSEFNNSTFMDNEQIEDLLKYLQQGNQENQERQAKHTTNIDKQNEEQQQEPKKDFFQRFKIRLDRSYKDRDDQFVKRLMKYQMNIMNTLEKQKIQPVKQRTQNDYDTVFSYEKLDKTSFEIIKEGLLTIKDMFPYTLLFNKKLFEIQVRDNRLHNQFNNFIIRKQPDQKLGKFNIGVCKIIEKQTQTTIRLAYQTDNDTLATVAIPIQMIGEQKRILKIPHNIPKIFKQFPLIGAQDTPYNYVFTSRKFYPNESRSNLMLKQIQGRNCFKADTNWQVLHNIFKIANILYKKLSLEIKNDPNYYLIKNCNFLGQKEPLFQKYYHQYQEMIRKLHVIQYRDSQYRSLNSLIYFKDSSLYQNPKSFSSYCNQIFSFLFDDEKILSKQIQLALYDVVQKGLWKIDIVNINKCLKMISDHKFSGIKERINQQGQAFKKITEIYSFLHKYKPEFITRNYSKLLKNNLFYVLNNQLEFVSIDQDNLKANRNLPKIYFDFFNIFDLKVNQNLIHDELVQYFNGVNSFSINDALSLIQDYFQFNLPEISNEKFKVFIKFMKTIKIGMNIIYEIQKLYCWNGIQPFNVDLTGFQEFSTKRSMLYKQKLFTSAYKKINDKIRDKNLSGLILLLKEQNNTDQQNKKYAIDWFNRIIRQEDSLKYIYYTLSWSEEFISRNKLLSIANYPDQIDINFYNEMMEKYNNKVEKQCRNLNKKYYKQNYQQRALKKLQDLLIHPDIAQKKLMRQTQYNQLFKFSVDLFSEENSNDKMRFLKYLDIITKKANDENNIFARQKIKIYTRILAIRHIELAKLLTFQLSQVTALYDIIKKKDVIEDLSKFIKNRENQDIKKMVHLITVQWKDLPINVLETISKRKNAINAVQDLLTHCSDEKLNKISQEMKKQ